MVATPTICMEEPREPLVQVLHRRAIAGWKCFRVGNREHLAVAASMTVKTRAAGAQWYSNVAVDQVFTTHHGQNGVGEPCWSRLRREDPDRSADGVTNMLGVFTLARTKSKPVTIQADTTTVFQAYL